ncbi:MAG: T9SS type A sorting domain-containing protein [Prevotellaceae bacterium]|nr:T9SS type A sorting domain-containing protein [Prevotellaceae bacterium]
MHRFLQNCLFLCALISAGAASAQSSHDLAITSVGSPSACALTEQPVQVTVRNSGQDTVRTITFGVIKDGIKLFEQQVDTVVAKRSSVTVTLDKTVSLEYGKTDTLYIYAHTDEYDTNTKNDTTVHIVAMPKLVDFPLTWNASTAETDYSLRKWEFDSELGNFYISGKGSNWSGNHLKTEVLNFPADDYVMCNFDYHVVSSDVTLELIADYGSHTDTIYSGNPPVTSTTGYKSMGVFFKPDGLAQMYFHVSLANAMDYGEAWLTNIEFVKAVKDLSATSIISPAVSKQAVNSNGTAVTVRFTNNSPYDVENPTFCFNAGADDVKEAYTGTIKSTESIDYTFSARMPSADGTYILKAWCEAEGDGNNANDSISAEYTFYTPKEFPYTTTFDEGNDLWTTVDVDNDGTTWEFTDTSSMGGVALCPAGTADDADNYLISPAIKMPAGRSRISFYYTGTTARGNTTLKVLMGNAPDPASMKEVLFEKAIENDVWLNGFSLIELESDSICYFAFHTSGSNDNIYIDNLYIDNDEDLCINSIAYDTKSGFNKTTANVTISYINHGVSVQNNVAVKYFINSYENNSGVEETVTESVEPGDTIYYTFKTPADISVSDSAYTLIGVIATKIGPDQVNDSIVGSTIANWANQKIPYLNTFDDTDRNAQWTGYNTEEGEDTEWGTYTLSANAYSGTMALRHRGNVTEGYEDWAFSECIEIPKGQYEISFFYRTNVNSATSRYRQSFSVKLGNGAAPENMTTDIVDFKDILVADPFYKKFNGVIDIPEDGLYYIGFCSTSYDCASTAPTYIEDLKIDNITTGSELPYTSSFATDDTDWTKYNTKTSDAHWAQYTEADGTIVERVERTADHASLSRGFEDKLTSPALYLEPDKTVKITVDYALSSDSTSTTLDMYGGLTDNPDSLYLLASMPIVAESSYNTFSYTFDTGEGADNYYIGFRTNSPVTLTGGYVYDARIRSVNVAYDNSSAIDNIKYSDGIGINLINGMLNVKSDSAIGNISIYDMQGRKAMMLKSGLNELSTDISALKGIYIIEIESGNSRKTEKIIIK